MVRIIVVQAFSAEHSVLIDDGTRYDPDIYAYNNGILEITFKKKSTQSLKEKKSR